MRKDYRNSKHQRDMEHKRFLAGVEFTVGEPKQPGFWATVYFTVKPNLGWEQETLKLLQEKFPEREVVIVHRAKREEVTRLENLDFHHVLDQEIEEAKERSKKRVE